MKADRLRGGARKRIIGSYMRGVLTRQEAAAAIGVHWYTVLRACPKGFRWPAARAQHVARIVERLTAEFDDDRDRP